MKQSRSNFNGDRMRRAFDILPPYPPKKHHRYATPEKKAKKQGRQIFWFLFIVVFVIILIFGFGQLQRLGQNNPATSTSSSNNSQSSSSQFELFNEGGQSNLLQSQAIGTAKILDGSGQEKSAAIAKDILEKARFHIEKVEKSANNYEKTIVYYKKGGEKLAQTAAENLKPTFEVETQESDNLDKGIDILVIVGAKWKRLASMV